MNPDILTVRGLRSRFGWAIALGLAMAAGLVGSIRAAPPDFAAAMADPPAPARILKIIHGWPDDPDAQDGLIRKLQRQGFGGVVCNVSFDQYLQSESKWEAFRRAVGHAKEAGMALWLYDERGYPSGNAGGLVLRDHPEWEARGWLAWDTECGPGPVELKRPPGDLVLAAAFPIRDGRIDLEGKVDLAPQVRKGAMRWEAPPGRWHAMVATIDRLYEGTHAEGNLFEKMPYVNLLMPEPTRRFLELTHQRYAEQVGADLGRIFVATFTDEPSLMSCYLKPMPWRPLPWAPSLPAEFRQRRGYPLDESVLPALIGNIGDRGARIRYDYWRTVGDLVSAHYFGQIQERCREWRIPSGGHLLAEESLVAHVPLYGDSFQCIRRLDAPSMDCLTSVPAEVPWLVARLAASAAELEEHPVVMCETSDHAQVWRGPEDRRPKRVVSEAEIHGTCNRLIVSGVNSITSYYSFTDMTDDALRRLNEWIGRCCAALAGGCQAADVALLYPIESVWPMFRPARQWANDAPGAAAIENIWRAAAESLYAAQREFTVVDSRALAEAAVEAGALVHGKLRWRVLALPGVDTLPEAAWTNLERFVRSGGAVIALGARPRNSETDFPSAKVQALGRELFGETTSMPSMRIHGRDGAAVFLPAGWEGLLPIVLNGLIEPDVAVHAPRSPVRVAHRRVNGRDVYFLINDSGKAWRGEATVSSRGPGERWDPGTGAIANTNLSQRVRLDLEPHGAVLLRYPSARTPNRLAPRGDTLPNLALRSIPQADPGMIQGEHVRTEIGADAARSTADRPVWRASSTLKKSQVDTFMFMRFSFPDTLDLEGAECLVLDAWVPEGQRTPTQLLVIVQEKGGGDFIASTGCMLGVSGPQRVWVPIRRLELAGWSPDSDGELDWKRVGEIRIGWGGYLGSEGERIEFSAARPRIGYRQGR
ncbi:MAG TPA: glycosyl hydrolase [Candidatus Paceibacterota bacterium]|nr:glycosyl hydrolase [Verrucomicrobiota bacterium]HRZ45371.1 glycosyl hydrolase [Candidatus Paceibacterota bacterium]HRZ54016.1 glycosyl hydrolase [Candidatus Paceibacterota bacterium]